MGGHSPPKDQWLPWSPVLPTPPPPAGPAKAPSHSCHRLRSEGPLREASTESLSGQTCSTFPRGLIRGLLTSLWGPPNPPAGASRPQGQAPCPGPARTPAGDIHLLLAPLVATALTARTPAPRPPVTGALAPLTSPPGRQASVWLSIMVSPISPTRPWRPYSPSKARPPHGHRHVRGRQPWPTQLSSGSS